MKTRRKLNVIKRTIPTPVFWELMKPLESGDAVGLEWNESRNALVPTDDKPTYQRFKYVIRKPSLLDKVWRLEQQSAKRVKGKALRRGLGCAKLQISNAGVARGEVSSLLSQVTGNVTIDFKVPKKLRAMPTLKMTFAVATMDQSGHINWPTQYEARTAAALRKQMMVHIEAMRANAEYPTIAPVTSTAGGDTVLQLKFALRRMNEQTAEIPHCSP